MIYADTSRPWMIAAYACWRQGFTVGTIYATLGEEGALFGINQSKCKAVVRQQALRVASWWRDSSPRWPQLSGPASPGADAAGAWLRYALGTSRGAASRASVTLRCGRAAPTDGAAIIAHRRWRTVSCSRSSPRSRAS